MLGLLFKFDYMINLIICCLQNILRGFSTVHLVSEAGSDHIYALKKMRCHSAEDEAAADQEIQYHKKINHPSVIECKGSAKIGSADISNNRTSMVLLLLPLYKVRKIAGTNYNLVLEIFLFPVRFLANAFGKTSAPERAAIESTDPRLFLANL